MTTIFELRIYGAQPWPESLAEAYSHVLAEAESRGTVLGYGRGIHPDASGPCFAALEAAAAAADQIQGQIPAEAEYAAEVFELDVKVEPDTEQPAETIAPRRTSASSEWGLAVVTYDDGQTLIMAPRGADQWNSDAYDILRREGLYAIVAPEDAETVQEEQRAVAQNRYAPRPVVEAYARMIGPDPTYSSLAEALAASIRHLAASLADHIEMAWWPQAIAETESLLAALYCVHRLDLDRIAQADAIDVSLRTASAVRSDTND